MRLEAGNYRVLPDEGRLIPRIVPIPIGFKGSLVSPPPVNWKPRSLKSTGGVEKATDLITLESERPLLEGN